jgi:hypothetical protein
MASSRRVCALLALLALAYGTEGAWDFDPCGIEP